MYAHCENLSDVGSKLECDSCYTFWEWDEQEQNHTEIIFHSKYCNLVLKFSDWKYTAIST